MKASDRTSDFKAFQCDIIFVGNQFGCPSKPVKAIRSSWAFAVCDIRLFWDIPSLAGFSSGACDALRNRCDLLFGAPSLFKNCYSMSVRENA